MQKKKIRGRKDEMRRKTKNEKLNSKWEVTFRNKSKMGLSGPECACAWWCCQQCLVFISCLVLNPVWLATAWIRGGLLDQLVRRQHVEVSGNVMLQCLLFSCQNSHAAHLSKTVQEGLALCKCDLDGLVSVSVVHLWYWDVCHYFCLGGCVFSGISLHLV